MLGCTCILEKIPRDRPEGLSHRKGAEQRGSALPGGVMQVPKGEDTPKPTLEEE